MCWGVCESEGVKVFVCVKSMLEKVQVCNRKTIFAYVIPSISPCVCENV